MPSPVWELTPGVQGHDDPSVDVRDLSVPVSGPQKALLTAMVLTALLLRGLSPTEVRQQGPWMIPTSARALHPQPPSWTTRQGLRSRCWVVAVTCALNCPS